MPPGPPPAAENRLLGIAARIGSATAFAGMGALAKAAMSGQGGANAAELVFYRSAGGLAVVTLWLLAWPGWRAAATRQPLAHLTRSTFGVVGMLLTFGALALLPLAEATTLTYSAPLSGTILSALLLGETVGPRRWLAVLAGFAGVVLVANPSASGGAGGLPALGIAVAVGASFAQASVMITVRQIGRTERTPAIVFWFMVISTAAGAVLLVPFGHSHTPATYALLAAAGVCGGIGQISMTASLRLAPVSVVVPFDYVQMLWATLLGWLLFAAHPGRTMLAGAALIAASGIYTALRERNRGVVPAQAAAPPEA